MKLLGITLALLGAFFASLAASAALAQQPAAATIAADLDPNSAAGIRIEGLVSDSQGRLYTSDLDSRRLFRITPGTGTVTGTVEVLGTLPRTGSGMAFDAAGNLYFASGDVILRINSQILGGSQITTTDVLTFATGVTGANGLAFGPGSSNLYVSGGATGNIYIVASDGITKTFASGFKSDRAEQQISTNGLAFGPDGKLYSSNTGTGAIDKVTINADGTAGTVERFVTDPLLLGADGITFASNGDLYVAANERNAIVRVTPAGVVSDVASNNNEGPLEFPASPSFSGNALYASNFDIARGANAPNTPGIGASIARLDVGVSGAPLPAPVAQTTPVPAVTASVAAPTVAPPTGAQPSATVVVAPTAPAVMTPTEVVEPTIEPVPTAEVIDTPISPPGMPSTGGSDSSVLLLLLALVGGTLTALGGVMVLRRRHY